MATPRRIVAMLVAAVTCALAAPRDAVAQKRQRDRISREEIVSSPHKDLDLYQVIRALRPNFLQPPPGARTLGGSYGVSPVAVYVDGTQETGIDALRTMTALRVEEVRYLDPTRSENEFGPRANGGAIVIKLYKAPKVTPRPVGDSSSPAPPTPAPTPPAR
jgi:hypothetical protein